MIGFFTDEQLKATSNPQTRKSILEEYPEYDFEIANTVFSHYSRMLFWFAVIPVFWGGLLVVFLTGAVSRLRKLKARSPRIIYIQKSNKKWHTARQFLFVVDENRKWGLVSNKNFKMLIEPQYDSMRWIKKNKIIEVKVGNQTTTIDVNNNICI